MIVIPNNLDPLAVAEVLRAVAGLRPTSGE
jgi:hypothetical protein